MNVGKIIAEVDWKNTPQKEEDSYSAWWADMDYDESTPEEKDAIGEYLETGDISAIEKVFGDGNEGKRR